MPLRLNLNPTENKSRILIPDSTPELLRAYAVDDRQMHFAFVRHNNVLQLFSGIVCWHLQTNALSTQPAQRASRILMDELYVGIDSYGHHHAALIMAFEDALASTGQLKRASAYLRNNFPRAHHGLIALEPIGENAFALFALEANRNNAVITFERHFELVKAASMSG